MGVNGGGVGRGWVFLTDGQPSPVYLKRSYRITLQRQIDILLTKQTTHVLHASSPLPSLLSRTCVCIIIYGHTILKVVFAYISLKEVISACVKHQVRSHNNKRTGQKNLGWHSSCINNGIIDDLCKWNNLEPWGEQFSASCIGIYLDALKTWDEMHALEG